MHGWHYMTTPRYGDLFIIASPVPSPVASPVSISVASLPLTTPVPFPIVTSVVFPVSQMFDAGKSTSETNLVGGYNSWIDQGFNIDQGFDIFTSTPYIPESLDEGKPDGDCLQQLEKTAHKKSRAKAAAGLISPSKFFKMKGLKIYNDEDIKSKTGLEKMRQFWNEKVE
ncbi:Hypothetical predicted protein [Paramuricea clavata]|uniref:Uncharacterized protein n=1 Tax=Paramuricea clavata TaxID=317549 RepID=A0A7D9JI71_PARCT|nr:Hypothetical predicted protein [Paramuricea clavata]